MFVFEFVVRMQIRMSMCLFSLSSQLTPLPNDSRQWKIKICPSPYVRSVSFYCIETVNDVNPSDNGVGSLALDSILFSHIFIHCIFLSFCEKENIHPGCSNKRAARCHHTD